MAAGLLLLHLPRLLLIIKILLFCLYILKKQSVIVHNGIFILILHEIEVPLHLLIHILLLVRIIRNKFFIFLPVQFHHRKSLRFSENLFAEVVFQLAFELYFSLLLREAAHVPRFILLPQLDLSQRHARALAASISGGRNI